MTPALLFQPTSTFHPPPLVTAPVAADRHTESGGAVDPEVYRRRRLVVLAVVLGVVLGIASFGRQAGADRTVEAEAADVVTVVVQPGDTLWGIAATLTPGDPRPLATELAELAGGTELQPGQRIVVPGRLLD